MESWRDDLTISARFVRENEVYVAVSGGKAIGFYALVGGEQGLELEHLWVLPAWIGTGLGRVLFEHATGRAVSLGAKTIVIESDPNAEGFYRKMGAKRVGANVYEMEGRERTLPLMVLELPRKR